MDNSLLAVRDINHKHIVVDWIKEKNAMKKVIYLFVLCMVLGLAGCGQSQENKEPVSENASVQTENKEPSSENTSAQIENKEPASESTSAQAEDKNVSDTVSSEHLTNNDTANFQMPEEGYYSNDYDEILRIKKEDDGTYNIIEYSITHLLYVENATGIYNSETGILEFSGKDDSGNDIKAEIENKGDYLEVTVTQSSHEDIIGTKQEFFQANE